MEKSSDTLMKSKLDENGLNQFMTGLQQLSIEEVVENLLKGYYDKRGLIDVVKFIIKSNYRFSSEKLIELRMTVNSDDYIDGSSTLLWSLAHFFARFGYVFSVSELIIVNVPRLPNGSTVAHIMAMQDYPFEVSDLIAIGNPKDYYDLTVAHLMAFRGKIFSVNEILLLGDTHTQGDEDTISLIMAMNGHLFTFHEIMRLGNPYNWCKCTIAHWMARYGHCFSINELLLLRNPKISLPDFDFSEGFGADQTYSPLINCDEYYRSMRGVYHRGATVAHIMAREGHRFTDEEITALGNPKDREGMTIADWMNRTNKL
jgi:hypothetical protein